MNKLFIYATFLFLLIQPVCSAAGYSVATLPPIDKPLPNQSLLKKPGSLKIKDMQVLLGRRLTLKEKIAFLILRKKIKATALKDQSKGQTAFIFGIGAVCLLALAFVVPQVTFLLLASIVSSILAIIVGSSAHKKDPEDKKAKTAKLLGWITLGIITALAVIAVIALSNWSWG